MGKKKSEPGYEKQLSFFTTLIKSTGLPGFVVFMSFVVFFGFFSAEQKSEFIDKYILLKTIKDDPWPAIFIIIFLVLLNAASIMFYRLNLKVLKKENQRIGKEKSDLQEKLLNIHLHSSD